MQYPDVPFPDWNTDLPKNSRKVKLISELQTWITSKPLVDLVEACGGAVPKASDTRYLFEWYDEFSAQHWDFRRGQERNLAEIPELTLNQQMICLDVVRALGIIEPRAPKRDHYNYVLILGGLVRACVTRPRLVAELVSHGTIFEEILALGGFRKLAGNEIPIVEKLGLNATDEFEAMMAGVELAFGTSKIPISETSEGGGRGNGDWAIARFNGVNKISVMAAPSSQPEIRRANSADTFEWWASRVNDLSGKHLLLLTSSIYVPYQGAAESHVIRTAKNAFSSNSPRRPTSHSTNSNSGYVTGTGLRAEEGADSYQRVEDLMSVARQKFHPITHVILPPAPPVDPKPWMDSEWFKRKSEIPFWKTEARRNLKVEVSDFASRQADLAQREAQEKIRLQQLEIDVWWRQINDGEPKVMESSLSKAFSDKAAEVGIRKITRTSAVLVLSVPSIDVLPRKRANVTPTGRLSSKVWTASEKNDVYASLIGAHLLATLREAWAVTPSLSKIRVMGLRMKDDIEDGFIFEIDAEKSGGSWNDDEFGEKILKVSEFGLNRVGRAQVVENWPHFF